MVVVWIAIAVSLPLTFPSLTEMVQQRPVAILPADAPVTATTRQMTEAFHESGTDNVALVVLTNDKPGPADEDTYRTLVQRLRADNADVVMLQDFVSTPALRELMTSDDGRAWILPVGIAGEVGSPQSYAAYNRVAGIVRTAVEGSSLSVHLTGPAATVADLTEAGERDRIHIEIATIVLVLLILLVIYRNVVTMLLPLMTIGISLVTAQSVIAGLAYLGMGISNQTVVFLTAMMAGAGTDYAVFLVSRYHDYLRDGMDSDAAVCSALGSIGKVITASAATVAVTFLGMAFAKLGLFATVGVALAVAIGIALTAAMTFLPAVMVLAGRRGWIAPRRDLTTRFWRRSGIRIVRRPVAHLVAGLLVLGLLAGCAAFARFNYDDRKVLPASAASSIGYQALESHFPVSAVIPQYLYINAPEDLRTPKALADLEQMAERVSQVPGVAQVRGITRPAGQSLEQARLSFQAGQVGNQLDTASKLIGGRSAELDQLAGGADTVADSLFSVRGQVSSALTSVSSLADALTYISKLFGGTKTFDQIDNAVRLVSGMQALGDALSANFADISGDVGWANPVMAALDASPVCNADPVCVGARARLAQFVALLNDGTFAKLADIARQLQLTNGSQTLGNTATNLRNALGAVSKAMKAVGANGSGGMQNRLTSLQQGANTLADASRKVADGVAELVDQTKMMGAGLDGASSFLLAMRNDAASPQMAGFYIPPEVLTGDEFKTAATAFISPDGHSVRYLVETDVNPFSTQAMDLVNAVTQAARSAQPNTVLAQASVSMAGYPVMLRDTRDYYNGDIKLIVAVTIVVVLLILMLVLRAVIAPLYLIASVVISYLSALGIGVIVFQFLLGQQLHWSVPGLTFIVLVAVGADYNLLLISRIRDESSTGVRLGVIRTVGSTGGVITAAGLIFAASMFGLLFASITTVAQAGFIIGTGILLDTFLVRTLTVPAIAALVGPANWWPFGRATMARGTRD